MDATGTNGLVRLAHCQYRVMIQKEVPKYRTASRVKFV